MPPSLLWAIIGFALPRRGMYMTTVALLTLLREIIVVNL